MSEPSAQQAHVPETMWTEVVDRALAGDRAAYGRLARLVTGFLAQWRAYDFRPDWDDMVQEVLVSVVAAYREGRLEPPGALEAYARQAARFKFIDRIRAQRRQAPDANVEEKLDEGAMGLGGVYWPPEQAPESDGVELRMTLARALETLPERERLAVVEVYVHGRTYGEAAEETGIPFGSLKRALRTGLAQLREVLDRDGPV